MTMIARESGHLRRGRSSSKFKNQWTTIDGIKFQSKREAMHYLVLKDRLRCKEIERLERQVRYPMTIDGVLVCTYVADFRYVVPGKGYVVEDVKGFKTDVYEIKKKLLKALYHIDVVED